jgi:signal peptidase I
MRIGSILILLLSFVGCDTLKKSGEYTFNRFKISSPSMTPTLPVGMTFSVLSADSFSVNQIIAFNPPGRNFPGLDTSSVWVCRLVGVPGDKLQMIKGRLMLNDQLYPFSIALKHSYRVTTSMPLNEKRIIDFEYSQAGTDEYIFYLGISEIDQLKKNGAVNKIESRILEPEDESTDGDIFVGGNRDSWGPLIIPPENYFVLGDSRHNALDSRYLGYIPAGNVKGFAAIEGNK